MKLTVIKALLLPLALLALGGTNHASAAPACLASYTMATVIAGGFSCTIGDLTFSNFAAAYTPGGGAIAPDPALDVTVNFAEMSSGSDPNGTPATAGSPIISVITDYTGDNSVDEFETLGGVVQYVVTDTGPPATSIVAVDAAITGSALNSASGFLNKFICPNNAFEGGATPDGTCPVAAITATSDLSLSTPGTQADGTFATFSLSNMGVYDGWTLAGGSTSPLAVADVTSVENDFIETGVTPEPGTFVLLGGALLGLGVIRRRRKLA
jgi:hypothetical protein